MSGLDPRERHRLEDDALARRHAREKRAIEGRRRKLALVETRERLSREKALSREQRLQAEARLERERTAEQTRSMDMLLCRISTTRRGIRVCGRNVNSGTESCARVSTKPPGPAKDQPGTAMMMLATSPSMMMTMPMMIIMTMMVTTMGRVTAANAARAMAIGGTTIDAAKQVLRAVWQRLWQFSTGVAVSREFATKINGFRPVDAL
jgi:hypothetical protein